MIYAMKKEPISLLLAYCLLKLESLKYIHHKTQRDFLHELMPFSISEACIIEYEKEESGMILQSICNSRMQHAQA